MSNLTVKELEHKVGKMVADVKVFKVHGTFKSLYAAQGYLNENGYQYGSLCKDEPVAAVKGEYTLPEKWYNINEFGRKVIDAVMVSNDFREGEVSVIIFGKSAQLN